MEEALYDPGVMRQFVGVDLAQEPVPDVTTVCKFRYLLEEHHLGGEISQAVNLYLQSHGVKIMKGTIVETTIVHALSSTKNRKQKRDPAMHQTKKGKQSYFGMQAHVGVDGKTMLIHSVAATAVVGVEPIAKVTCKAPSFSRFGVRFFSESRRSSSERAHRALGYYLRFDVKAGVAQTGEGYRLRGWI